MLLRLLGHRPSPCVSRRIAGISLVALLWTVPIAAAPGPSEPVRETESLILLLALPPDVTREDVLTGEQPTRTDLLRLASARVAPREGRESVDRIVILVDHAGEPILPDLDEARRHLIAGEAVHGDPSVPVASLQVACVRVTQRSISVHARISSRSLHRTFFFSVCA